MNKVAKRNSNNGLLDIGTLSGHLWEAANILRGPVDAADFKTYIFPLLFFRRICAVYDEEFKIALLESDGDMEYARFPENHRFQVPEGCHWRDVRATSANIGYALQKAMRCIEQANPDTLHGIFGDAQWTNKDRLSDRLLKDLIEHFSSLDLGNEHCKADILGQAYEYLIKKFADLTNKKAGEFYTPRAVVALMIRILAPQAGDTIYDPACGTGGMLLEALHFVPARRGRFSHRKGRYAPAACVLFRRQPGRFWLRDRQSTVFPGKVGRGSLGQRSLWPHLCRSAARQVR